MRGLLAFALLAACGGPSAERPLGAVDSYVAALRGGDYGRAYELMSSGYRRGHSKDDFVRMLKESPAEVKQTAERLSADGRKVEVSARFVTDDLHDELPLVFEGGSWRLSSDPLEFYPQDSPPHALRSFLRAIELHRYDVLLRFVPNQWRAEMTAEKVKEQFEGERKEEISRMVRLLTANLENPIDIEGDRARMPYGDRYEVKFIREDGVWKIKDPD
jgi:hypothetical protein